MIGAVDRHRGGDKNFAGRAFLAVQRARQDLQLWRAREPKRASASACAAAPLVVFAGLFVEIVMSLGVLTGVADRAAAAVLALYCCLTALGWKQFWRPGDFFKPDGVARGLFWDFWKNFALAGGFLLITFGTSADSARLFFDAPLSSTHPYRVSSEQ